MRQLLAFVFSLLLPLQSLQAATNMPCGLVGMVGHAVTWMDGHVPHPDAHPSVHQHMNHADSGADQVAGDSSASTSDDHCGAHGSAHLDGCCHLVVSLPMQTVSFDLVPLAGGMHGSLAPALLSHTTSGPFRPPRISHA